MPFQKDGYTLYSRRVTLEGGRQRTIYFFAKMKPKLGRPVDLPRGYELAGKTPSGAPILRRKGGGKFREMRAAKKRALERGGRREASRKATMEHRKRCEDRKAAGVRKPNAARSVGKAKATRAGKGAGSARAAKAKEGPRSKRGKDVRPPKPAAKADRPKARRARRSSTTLRGGSVYRRKRRDDPDGTGGGGPGRPE